MDIEAWINENLEKIKVAIIKTLAQLSKTTIAVIFDEECAKCSEESRLKECFIPYLTTAGRIKMFLLLIVEGFLYKEMKSIGFEEIIRAEMWESISTFHSEFLEWKTENCKNKKGKERERVDSYVS